MSESDIGGRSGVIVFESHVQYLMTSSRPSLAMMCMSVSPCLSALLMSAPASYSTLSTQTKRRAGTRHVSTGVERYMCGAASSGLFFLLRVAFSSPYHFLLLRVVHWLLAARVAHMH